MNYRLSTLVSAAAFLTLHSFNEVSAEIRSGGEFLLIQPGNMYYKDGFIETPGYVDVTDLIFSTVDTDEKSESQVEFFLFHQPMSCSSKECFLYESGVGEYKNEGYSWCSDSGKLMIDQSKFSGEYLTLNAPSSGEYDLHVQQGRMIITADKPSGGYILGITNCNSNGKALKVGGEYSWKSHQGYLPGDLFGEMHFFIAMTVLYFILFIWYCVNIRRYVENTKLIQKYIVITIGIGLVEAFVKSGDYFIWNENGERFWFSTYFSILLCVSKRTITRCLVVLVSQGFGVTQDELDDDERKKMFFLGGSYFLIAGTMDLLKLFSILETPVLGLRTMHNLHETINFLVFVVTCFDVSFFMWVLNSLKKTMKELEEMKQSRKLYRYLRLRFALTMVLIFAVLWALIEIFKKHSPLYDDKIAWGFVGAWELNYFFVLASISFLWKPDSFEIAYALEVSAEEEEDLNNFSTKDSGYKDNPEPL